MDDNGKKSPLEISFAGPDLDFQLSEQVRTATASDPELASALKDMLACFRQAHHAVAAGQYASFEDAVEALTGARPERIETDDEDDDSP